jgi:dTDP-4-dehydrorhamnose reductase
LAAIAVKKNFRLITVSTDCVFDGATGTYTEDSKPNSQDLYGISKRLGEVSDNSNVLTIRTSIIGPELSYHASILDWFLGQTGSVSGFTNAFFSGVTTLELSKIIQSEILRRENVSGLYQIASERISKFQLLTLFNDVYNRNIEIKPSSDFKIDRSLSAKKFFDLTGYKPPSWVKMIKEMKSYG